MHALLNATALPYRLRLLIAAGLWFVYVLILGLLYFTFTQANNPYIISLTMVPLMTSAWLLGRWPGLLIGLATYPFNVLLYGLFGYSHMDVLLLPETLGAILGTGVIGLVVGQLGQLQSAMGRQFARQQQIEAALRASEARYRAIFENSPVGFFQSTPEGRYLTVNPAMAHMFGYASPDEMLSGITDIASQIHVNPARRQDFIRLMSEQGEVLEFVNQNYHKDGRHIHTLTNARAVRDQAGSILYYEGFMTDITARADAEDALRESETRYRSLVERMPGIVYSFSTRRGGLYYSPHTEAMLGYTPDDLYARPMLWHDSIHSDDLPLVDDSIRQIEQGLAFHIEYRVRDAHGNWHWFDDRSFHNLRSDADVIIDGLAMDITDRKQAEAALRTSRDYLQAVLDAANDAVFVDDADTGQIIDVNQRMCEMYGYTRDEALRTSIGDLSQGEPPYSQAEALAWLHKAHEIGPQTFEWQARRKDGQLFWAEVSTRFAMFGRDARFVVTVRDISERKRAETALRETEERFRLAFDTSPDAINITRLADGLYVDINHGFTTLTGFTRQDIVGKTSADINIWHNPADRQRLVQDLQTAGYCENLEAQFRRKDGSLTTALMSARIIMLQGVPHILSVTRDITERKRMEEILQISEERYRGLFEDSPISMWEEDFSQVKLYLDALRQSGVTDLRTYLALHPEAVNTCADLVQVLDVNQATLDLLEVPDKATVLTNLNRTLAMEAHAPFRDEINTLAEGARQWVGNEVQHTASGREVFITVNVSIASGYADTWGKVLVSILDITERKQVEEALRASESLYHSLVDISPLSICRKDLAGRFTFANRRFLEASKITLADLVGKTDFDLHPPELAAKFQRDDREVMDSGQSREFIEERAVLGGEITVIQSYKTPIYDGTGKISGIQISFWDITARQRAERAERDQRELAETLREVAALLTGTLDLAAILDQMLTHIGRVVPHTTANVMLIDEAAGLAHVIRARGYDQISPELAGQVLNFSLPLTLTNLRRMIDTRQPVIIDDTATSPDWVVTPETAWTRSYLGAPIVLRDQTLGIFNLDSDQPHFFTAEHARRLMAFSAQAASAMENARLFDAERDARQLAESLRDTAAVLNSSLNLDAVLDQILICVARVVPHDGANIMLVDGDVARVARARGRCDTDTIGTERHTITTTDNLRTMRDTGEPCIFNHTRSNPNWITLPGHEWTASYAGMPIRVHGELLGYLGLYSTQPGHFTLEHTRRLKMFAAQAALAIQNAQLHASIQQHAEELEQRVRQRTRQLSEANERLTELDRLKDDFISRISHELRTPLTSIKIYLELLETGKPEKRARYMQVLTEQANRLQQLIESLLEVTQKSTHAADLHVAPTDLNRLVASLVADVAPRAAQRGLTLTMALTPDLPFAAADGLLLAQVLSNLATNALNYTPAGGRLDLSTAQVIENDETWITFTIRDTGPGIAPDELPHIFDRFYRGRAAADYTIPGAGVGLSISRDIVTALGGRLTVDNPPGAGATFTVWLKPA